jgi:hypothetical protein
MASCGGKASGKRVEGTGSDIMKGKGKAIPVHPWTSPDVSRRLKLPDFNTIDT